MEEGETIMLGVQQIGTTISVHSGSGSRTNDKVLHIPQSSSTEAS